MEANPENIAGSAKKINKEYYYPTQVYFTDLAIAANMNAEIIPAIYKCRQQDLIGLVRTNTPQIGAWHSRTAMHTRKEFNSLTAEIFEFMHGVYDDLGYHPEFEPVCDSMWANINPKYSYNRHHTRMRCGARSTT